MCNVYCRLVVPGEAALTVITQVYHFQHTFRANLINNLVTISYELYQAASFTFDVVTISHRNTITFLANKGSISQLSEGRQSVLCEHPVYFLVLWDELKSLYVLNTWVDLWMPRKSVKICPHIAATFNIYLLSHLIAENNVLFREK